MLIPDDATEEEELEIRRRTLETLKPDANGHRPDSAQDVRTMLRGIPPRAEDGTEIRALLPRRF